MPARTIPEPSNTDYSVALTALVMHAKSLGLAVEGEWLDFLVDHAEVVAQLNAEVRWLRNMTHPRPHAPSPRLVEGVFLTKE